MSEEENYDDGDFEYSETSSHGKKNYTVLSQADICQWESNNIDDISAVPSFPYQKRMWASSTATTAGA